MLWLNVLLIDGKKSVGVIEIVNVQGEIVMSDLKDRIREILDEYKTANMYSESVRERIATELYEKLGDDDTHPRSQRHGWYDE